MLISSSKALSPPASFCIAQHCRDTILMFARMKKSLSCFWAASTTAVQATPPKAGEAGGRKTHLKPWTIYCTSLETAIRRPDLTAAHYTANTAEPPHTLLEPRFSSSVGAVQSAHRQAMPIRYDLASNTGDTKTVALTPGQLPSCSSLSISMGYYVYSR